MPKFNVQNKPVGTKKAYEEFMRIDAGFKDDGKTQMF